MAPPKLNMQTKFKIRLINSRRDVWESDPTQPYNIHTPNVSTRYWIEPWWKEDPRTFNMPSVCTYFKSTKPPTPYRKFTSFDLLAKPGLSRRKGWSVLSNRLSPRTVPFSSDKENVLIKFFFPPLPHGFW